MKYKNKIYSYIFSRDGSIYIRIELPSKLPMTTIINEFNNLNEQMFALYNKYINSENAIHEINISYELRKYLAQIFENINVKINESFAFNILDETTKEILELMIDSFKRFKQKYKNKLK